MPDSPSRAHDARESDQLPEEQPGGGHPGSTSTPGERKDQVGLDPRPDPDSRRNTCNPHDQD